MGQAVGATERRGERAAGPHHAATFARHLISVLGIDAGITFPDHTGRPQYLLDEPHSDWRAFVTLPLAAWRSPGQSER